MTSQSVRIIFPIGMLGGGITEETLAHGIALGADAIAVDGGSTDSGPHYLGSGVAKTSRGSLKRDLRAILVAGRQAGIPVVVTTCGTSGTDSGVEWVADIAREIAAEEGIDFTLARIYSELSRATVLEALAAGRVEALEPAGPLEAATVESCAHIVGLMGHEPITAALAAGADLVLTGRASDTASVAGIALGRGIAPGPVWHAAKTVECGSQCTTDPIGGGVLVEIDDAGFTVHPLTDSAAATPMTVAAHMLYENADPYRLREPGGTLDTSAAVYTALDERVTRVEGSVFEPAAQATIKLEGAAVGGYETVSLVGIRDPHVLAHMDAWLARFAGELARRVRSHLGLEDGEYDAELRAYGYNAVLGALEPGGEPPREVGVLFRARAADQATATAIAKVANPLMLHLPLEGMTHLPSFAFATSPAEIERGASYEFVLQHTIAVDDEGELFRTEYEEVHARG
ncbi:acyclic terpene utilization AtuA family protein [Protaetiibacter intestinalis]|uniref:Acyclic terpene utilization AtuA family protein n=1 Tax=Protaetiibacter intestinalis TaxID=2419774 RepID=A0A387B701_9MICO|nr:acyclic terpene utilization AtuA family protein [Protaetiibacter intestinalis]AYF98123.1 acyclic terpene utilization AtuA family protein [Protaetiibacter intestinalis]